jgi:hypothetical protein
MYGVLVSVFDIVSSHYDHQFIIVGYLLQFFRPKCQEDIMVNAITECLGNLQSYDINEIYNIAQRQLKMVDFYFKKCNFGRFRQTEHRSVNLL